MRLMRHLGADFDDFVASRSTALMRTAILLTGGDVWAAEDLLQQALVRLASHWPRAREHPEAYVRRVLVNLSRDAARRRWRRPWEILMADPPSRESETAHVLDRQPLLDALRILPERQRAAVVLRFWEDRSVAEAADLLGCSEGTVKSNTARGLDKLRRALDPSSAAMEGSPNAD
jgi:RNA polymerase sigma-70 factor (sigma-E family)